MERFLLLGDSNFHYNDGRVWFNPWLSSYSTAMFVELQASAAGVKTTQVGWRCLRARSYDRMALEAALQLLDQLTAKTTVVVALGQNDALDFTNRAGGRALTEAEERDYENHVVEHMLKLRSDLEAHACVVSVIYVLPFDHSAAASFHPSYPKLMDRLSRTVRQKTESWKWRTMTYVPPDTVFLKDLMHLTRYGRMEFAEAICAAAVRGRGDV